MQTSASDDPFQFNFAASDNVAPSLKAFGIEEQKASPLSSVEVRPPASVCCGTAFCLPEHSCSLSKAEITYCSWPLRWSWIRFNLPRLCTFSRCLISPLFLVFVASANSNCKSCQSKCTCRAVSAVLQQLTWCKMRICRTVTFSLANMKALFAIQNGICAAGLTCIMLCCHIVWCAGCRGLQAMGVCC